jgi:serine/threonine protein kinase
MIGKEISNYRIEKLIGRGGMSEVYLANHTQIKRKVAVKILKESLFPDKKIRERFKNEAATLSLFQHPNIVVLYDYIEDKESILFVMEYVEGKTLDDFISTETGPLPIEKLIPLFIQILSGVEYAHNQNIIHRDIKPSNIIITKQGHVKILDFGIAKLLNSENHNLTKAGSRLGTALFMSPEQVKGGTVDIRTDIYSLGVTLFQMATGRCPYDNNSTEYEIYNKIVNEPLPDAGNIYIGISKVLEDVIKKATEKNPKDRYQSCLEFRKGISIFDKSEDLPRHSKI